MDNRLFMFRCFITTSYTCILYILLLLCRRKQTRWPMFSLLALKLFLFLFFTSFMMSVFHNGILRTMKAHYQVSEGDLRVIRPFVSVREKSLRDFAESRKLPIIAENCPACFEQPKVSCVHNQKIFPGFEIIAIQIWSSIKKNTLCLKFFLLHLSITS